MRIFLLLVIILLVAGCQQKSEVKEIKITAKQFVFTPSTIELKQGEKVRIILDSADVAHGLSIPDLGIDARAEPGKNTIIDLTPDMKGEFNGHCSVFCGIGHGDMKLKVVVS